MTTTAKGTGKITIADDKSVTGSIKTTGITGTAAHIHEAPAGQNGKPIITLEKKGDNEWAVPAGSKLTDEQLAQLQGGQPVREHTQRRAQGRRDPHAAQTLKLAFEGSGTSDVPLPSNDR